MQLSYTFEVSGRRYRTDAETLRVLGTVVDAYRKGGSRDASAVSTMMHLGIDTGRIVPMEPRAGEDEPERSAGGGRRDADKPMMPAEQEHAPDRYAWSEDLDPITELEHDRARGSAE